MPLDGPPIVPGVTDTAPALPSAGPGGLLQALLGGNEPPDRPARDKVKDAIALLREAAGDDSRLAERIERAIDAIEGRDDTSIRQREGHRKAKMGSQFAGVTTPI